MDKLKAMFGENVYVYRDLLGVFGDSNRSVMCELNDHRDRIEDDIYYNEKSTLLNTEYSFTDFEFSDGSDALFLTVVARVLHEESVEVVMTLGYSSGDIEVEDEFEITKEFTIEDLMHRIQKLKALFT